MLCAPPRSGEIITVLQIFNSMNTRHFLLAFLLLAALPLASFGQNKRLSKTYLTKQYGHFANRDSALNHRNYFGVMAEKMGLPDPTAMVLEQEIPGQNGYVHFKFQQYHAGLPIIGSTYILHEKDGWIRKANGHFTPNPTISAVPTISPAQAVKIAQMDMKAKTYLVHPDPVLCFIDPAFPKTSERLILVYQTDLRSVEPFDKIRYYVDATQGKIITQFPLILKEGVPSTAVTKYYGNVNITTDSIGPQDFLLHDPTRGGGITVLDINESKFENVSAHWDLQNDKQDEVALDAHYCSTRYYDMMLGDFGWDGLDGNGKALKIIVHNNLAGSVNAFWDGEYTNYGDGNCLNGPLTTMEVVGHEFTHAMVEYTSGLVYSNESGAINESLADMFGKALEADADLGNFDWDLGHSFQLSPGIEPFRVMDDPKSLEMPAFYGGEYWLPISDVHVNSSIGNLWFTMLVDGKQGINEANEAFNVPGLGMDKATQIAFLANKNYLTENSDYHDFYLLSLDAAEEIYGTGAPEIAATKEAWKAVGLPSSGLFGPDFDLAISSVGDQFIKVCDLGVFYPITVEISNLDQNSYLPTMNGKVTLSTFSLSDYTFNLTEALAPGEILSVEVDNWFKPIEPDIYWVNIEHNLQDDQFNNDETFTTFNVKEFPESDLILNLEINKKDCFSQEFDAIFYVRNNSCTATPAGTILDLSIENSAGTTLWSTTHVLAEDLPINATEILQVSLVLAASPMEEIIGKLGFDNDPDASNNEDQVVLQILNPIQWNYLNQFGNEIPIPNVLFIDTYLFPNFVTYQSKSYIGSIGLDNDPTFSVQCPDFADNFNNDDYGSGVNITLNACVDYSQFENSIMSFDMIQFRNNAAAAEGNLYTSMLQVKWDGNESGKKIFFGQPEGLLANYQIGLPKFFKGELEIKFYTQLGEGSLEPLYFPTSDVILLDNLQLLTNTIVSTDEVLKAKDILVSPNPAGDFLYIRSGEPLKIVELVSTDGKLIKRETHGSASFKIDLSGVENGLFFLRMETSSGAWTVQKVVKMAN